MQYLIGNQCLFYITDSGKKFPIENVHVVALESISKLMGVIPCQINEPHNFTITNWNKIQNIDYIYKMIQENIFFRFISHLVFCVEPCKKVKKNAKSGFG